jgi:hypothetical protein
MNRVYVVTESERDAEILKSLLPKEVVKNTIFVAASNSYSAHSSARSLLIAKRRPVALVMSTKTTDEMNIQEQADFLREWVGKASGRVPFKVLLAVPEMEAVLTETPSLLAGLTTKGFSQMELDLAKLQPKQFLLRVLGEERVAKLTTKFINKLDAKTLADIRKHPLLNHLQDFLTSAIQPVNGLN